jgi:hypothetical protein
MADKTDTGEQPTLERLASEGIPLRKCISYEGLGEYTGNDAGKAKTAKKAPALSSMGPMRRGQGY